MKTNIPNTTGRWVRARGVGPVLGLCAALAFSGGCGKSESHDDHDGHDHGKLHVHVAPHGGVLVELGEHEANLELLHDARAGKLTAYVLDAHAENFLRIASPGFEVTAKVGGRDEVIAFKPVANPATGEKVGDTSQFETQADWLKTTGTFEGVVKELAVRTKTYQNVKFTYAKP